MIYRGTVSIHLVDGQIDIKADPDGHFNRHNVKELQAHLEYLCAKHSTTLKYLRKEGWNASVMELRVAMKGRKAFPFLALVSPDRAASPCITTYPAE